jgi:hypothetical protein
MKNSMRNDDPVHRSHEVHENKYENMHYSCTSVAEMKDREIASIQMKRGYQNNATRPFPKTAERATA